MPDAFDWGDPCAVLPLLREAYYALLHGKQVQTITHTAGNGASRTVSYQRTDGNLKLMKQEITELEAKCAAKSGIVKRFGLRSGGKLA